MRTKQEEICNWALKSVTLCVSSLWSLRTSQRLHLLSALWIFPRAVSPVDTVLGSKCSGNICCISEQKDVYSWCRSLEAELTLSCTTPVWGQGIPFWSLEEPTLIGVWRTWFGLLLMRRGQTCVGSGNMGLCLSWEMKGRPCAPATMWLDFDNIRKILT